MKKIKRIALLVVAVLVLLVAASGVKTVLDMKNSADNEVQEEDSTRWAEPTSDPLNIEGIADASMRGSTAVPVAPGAAGRGRRRGRLLRGAGGFAGPGQPGHHPAHGAPDRHVGRAHPGGEHGERGLYGGAGHPGTHRYDYP